MKTYGLIGYPLSHSFSKRYFTEKFKQENIPDCRYELFEIPSIAEFENLISNTKDLQGLNVTIPYKESVKDYLDDLDKSALKVGAVNVIKVQQDFLTGYNSDYFGFRKSLEKWVPNLDEKKALVLGSGGASKAVKAVLQDLKIPFLIVSRSRVKGDIIYDDLERDKSFYDQYSIIINTTPVGMSPDVDNAPSLNYHWVMEDHFFYDLVYNPEETLFLKEGKKKGAKIKNGLEMLVLQAERSWEIWNE